MSEYDNTNRGALFKNENPKSDKSPPYTGSLNVGGTDYWLSAWVEESKAGKKYFSVKVQPKEQPAEQKQQAPDFDDSIPF